MSALGTSNLRHLHELRAMLSNLQTQFAGKAVQRFLATKLRELDAEERLLQSPERLNGASAATGTETSDSVAS